MSSFKLFYCLEYGNMYSLQAMNLKKRSVLRIRYKNVIIKTYIVLNKLMNLYNIKSIMI